MNAMLRRRTVIAGTFAVVALAAFARLARGQQIPGAAIVPEKRWFEAAVAMKRRAQSRGDQSYGAVLVLHNQLVGEGPSRVIELGDSTAHAERVAIGDAQRRLRRTNLQGAVLYSTSRPCAACEAAAAAAGIGRMYFGEGLQDAGVPRP